MTRFASNNYDLSGVRRASENSYTETMNALNEGSWNYTSPYASKAINSDSDVAAFKAGSDAATQGTSWMSSFGEGMNQNLLQSVNTGFQNAGAAASHAEEMRAQEEIYKAQKAAMQQSQAQGLVGSVLGLATAFI